MGAGLSVDLSRASFHRIPEALLPVSYAGANEGGEERMRRERLGFEFGMELAAEEPGMIGHFDNFDVDCRRACGR